MNKLINELEIAGYLQRGPDPVDGRARLVYLTPRGRQVVQHIRTAIAEIEGEWERALGHRSFTQMRSALVDLGRLIQEGEGA
ncbi:MAG: hypothetical protein H0V26_03220 [Solirubrobacterales bacterium]|nr:hypothetical protein [Solirubrobacterales bacterium]